MATVIKDSRINTTSQGFEPCFFYIKNRTHPINTVWPQDITWTPTSIFRNYPLCKVYLFFLQKTDPRRVKFHFFVTGLGIHELKLEDYANGGINMTGFQMVDFTSPDEFFKKFFARWSSLDSATWEGAGQNKIGVSTHNQFTYKTMVCISQQLLCSFRKKWRKREPRCFY